jgi:hypothetical protein
LVGAHLWSFTTMRTPAGRTPPSSVYSISPDMKRGWFFWAKCTKGLCSCLPPVPPNTPIGRIEVLRCIFVANILGDM